MGLIQSDEYFEIKRAMEAFFTANNTLVEQQTRELIAVRKELNILNQIFGRATKIVEKRDSK